MGTPESGDPPSPLPTLSPLPKSERILLVEDNHAASKGLSRLLTAMGYEVQVVNDGGSALEVLRTSPPPDFVLTDLRLPDLDGREVALIARQLVPPPRIALITGWDLEHNVEDRAAWGIDWVFTKPLDVNALIVKLRGGSVSLAAPDVWPLPPSYEGGEGIP